MEGLGHARTLAQAGRWDEVIGLCRAGLADAPRDLDLLNLFGVALVSTNLLHDGIAVLRSAVDIDPAHPGPLTNLALALQRLGDIDAAFARFRQLCVLEPANAVALNKLGLILQGRGDLTTAARLLERAAQVAARDISYWVGASSAKLHAGDVDAAARLIDQALSAFPDDGFANMTAATLALRRGDLERAILLNARAKRADPQSSDVAAVAARIDNYVAAAQAVPPPGEAAPGLAIRGPFDTISGYAHMGRRYIQTLREQGVPLNVIGLTGKERWADEPLHLPVPARAMLNIAIPIAVEPVPGMAMVTYSMFEGPRIPSSWARLSASSDYVVVPTESSRLAWAAQGFPEARLRVCPLGVDAEPMAREAPPLTLVAADGRPVSSFRHRFLNVSDLIARKNLAGLLRVWLRATRRSDDAVLILKTGRGKANETAMLRDLLTNAEARIGRRFADAAPILLVNQMLDERRMGGLFAAANRYWSMSHGEGWDLPMSKAGAMGLCLIAPAHSAYLDYLDSSVARMIPAHVVPAREPYRDAPYPPFFGLDWWQPDEDAAAAAIEAIVQDRDTNLPDASAHLMANFTWGQATHRLRHILAAEGLMG